jgi:hypothetical protein
MVDVKTCSITYTIENTKASRCKERKGDCFHCAQGKIERREVIGFLAFNAKSKGLELLFLVQTVNSLTF